MSEVKRLTTPLTEDAIKNLHAGDSILLSGVIYTARDKAHKRLCDTLAAGNTLPVDLQDQMIYYVGPAPAKPGSLSALADRQHLDAWTAMHQH